MNRNKANAPLEYFSSALILSYFFIHEIVLVLIGISLSFYLLNINKINSYIRSVNQRKGKNNSIIDFKKNNKSIKALSNDKELYEENSRLTLVEIIEEFGFIPSIDKNNDSPLHK
tara:strand:+ start:891 stop:1235 length:345 start_codon:yes stop_codon:yes gene_type:complete